MIFFRLFFSLLFLMLAACAPKPPAMDAQNVNPPQTQVEAPTKFKSTATTSLERETLDSANAPSSAKPIKELHTDTSSASKISSWEVSGAMAARSKGKGWNASVNWIQQGPNTYQIRLSGPLGSGTVIVNRKGGVVTLRDGPKTASSSNADSLLKQQTGISLPISNLYYWARGIAAPGAVQGKKYDQSGRLQVLQQNGYTIEYQKYTSAGKAVLPSSIRLQGNGVFIKFIIKNWRV